VVKEIKGTFDSSNIPVLSFDPGMVSRPSREMLDEVVIDIKMFNGSVDVLRYAQGELHNGENILRKRVPRLSYSNYRHAKHGGRQGNYGWVVFIYSNYFSKYS
jgi:hypothetical protein